MDAIASLVAASWTGDAISSGAHYPLLTKDFCLPTKYHLSSREVDLFQQKVTYPTMSVQRVLFLHMNCNLRAGHHISSSPPSTSPRACN
jgi:hypothetical protein